MKRSLLFLLLLALFMPWAAKAQTTVTIGDGTATCNTNPIGTYYNYSITEQLYTAEEIGMAGTISSISFYYLGIAARDLPITVYMKHVDAADLSTAGISLADADEVFSGTLSVTTTAGWVTVDLNFPFAYDGTSNLLIGINKDYLYYFSGQSWQGTATTATMARYTQSDSAGPYTTSTVPGTAQANRPNIQMEITAGSGTVCDKPESIEATNITTNGATLTWTGGSGTYNVEYKGGDVEDWTAYLTNTTLTTKNVTGLTPGTSYSYRVQSVCGTDVSSWKSVSFTTMFGIPLVENFGTGIPTGWSMYNGWIDTILTGSNLAAATYGWNFGENAGVFDNHTYSNIYGTSCIKWLVMPTITMEDNVQLTFDVAYTAYTYGSTTSAPAQNGTDDKFIVAINDNGSWGILRQWDNTDGASYVLNDLNVTPTTVTLDLSSYVGHQVAVAFYVESLESNADNNLHIDNVSIDYIPACPKPTGLAVNYEGDLTAEVTWSGDATSYEIDVNGTVTTGVTSPYTLDNLELSTDYEVMVRANCGSNGYSEWVGPVTFTTDDCMLSDMTVVNYTLTDSYGDGWNDNYILVVDASCNIVDALTIESGSSLEGTVKVCGSYLQFLWFAGDYPGETSWVFTDADNNVLFEGTGSTSMATYDVLYTIDSSPYPAPSDITVIDLGPYGATIAWTENGTATAWEIMLNEDDSNIIAADSNPFTVTGLDPETEYFVQVRSTGSLGTSMWPCVGTSFTTLEGCTAPELTVTPYPFSADVDWTDWEGSYDLDWCQAPASKDGGIWLQYDNGTVSTNIGGSTSSEQTWGAMYPKSMIQGNKNLTKVAFYVNATYHTSDFTVNIYQGDDPISGTLLGTQTVTPATTSGMMEVELTSPITINPVQNLWITLTTTGTYVKTAAVGNEPNNRWVLSSGEWVDVATLNEALAGYGWMIRGYVDDYNPLDFDWTSETGVTPPYTIDGLDPETQYVVKVKASCGDAWTWYYFTTPSACDAPIDLEATDITDNSAMLSWIGYQDRYVLRYRTTDDVDPNLPATIILEAHDAWGDGTGYQMLLDADATAFGVEIPETGPYTGSDYSAFEYLIPENADCDSNTENIVFDGSVTLEIPAGVYDWCIVNPEPGGNMWIAGTGEIPSRNDDFIFEPGVTYHFTMQTGFGTGDGAVYEVIRPMAEWIEEDIAGETEFELTGLNPMAYYEWQVRGENDECTGGEVDGYTEWSEIASFTTTAPQGQTIELAAGWNWVSFYKDITMAELQAAIVAANPGAQPVIKSQADGQTTYNGAIWLGALRNLDLTQMYEIKVANACTITLNGDVIDAANFEITIKPGINWIAYPLNTTMAVADAFAGFSTRLDVVKSRNDGQANFMGAMWTGALKDLVPGQGYIYNSKATTSQPFTYPAPAKETPRSIVTNAGCRTKKDNTIDMILN